MSRNEVLPRQLAGIATRWMALRSGSDIERELQIEAQDFERIGELGAWAA
jgi:hypothetical protein